MEAIFSKPVKVPGNLQVGDTCEFVIDDFTGETVTAICTEGHLLTGFDENGMVTQLIFFGD